MIGDLFDDSGVLMSFERVKHKFRVPQKDFFAYLQACHFINTDTKLPQDKTLLGPIEESIIHYTRNRSFISYFYVNFLSYTEQKIKW